MDWLSPENVIAVATAVLGLLATVGALWYERRVPRRKRIGYRVQMDTAIGDNMRTGGANARLGLFSETPEMSDATLALLRIENDGSQAITDADYTGRALHGLTAVFEGRTVRGVAVTQPAGADHLMEHFTPAAGLRVDGSRLHVPRVPLNRGQHYKLLVLLTGGPVGGDITVTGGIHDGDVQPNRSHSTPLDDDKTPLFSRPARILTVLLTLCVVALASIIVVRDDSPPPIGCGKGTLTVTGSTAFAPVAEELARAYEKQCPGAHVAVSAHGSRPGLADLARTGAGRGKGEAEVPPVIAMSDGPGNDGYPQLGETRIAVSLFALVVNDRVPLRNLSVADVRRLYRGDVANWRQLGGPDLPVVLVSRSSGSGTRQVFQRRVLGGEFEVRASSDDCVRKDDAAAPVIRCEVDSTDQVLDTVARRPGAVGYSELRATESLTGLHRLDLDGHRPTLDHIATSGYPYREIEYAYTRGQPPADSLTAGFLAYATRGAGMDIIRTHGHLPCGTPVGLRICGAD